ncbi:hypothetical protein E4U24_001030 [Claviceps purpurea]|nr:hypothetical protein E4U24_001030 [Claviceps purpurea]
MDEVLPLARPNFALVADGLALAAEHVRRCINLPKGDLRAYSDPPRTTYKNMLDSQISNQAQILPNTRQISIGLGDAFIASTGLGDAFIAPIGLGDAFIAPIGLGDAFIASIGLGDAFIASQDDTTITSATWSVLWLRR